MTKKLDPTRCCEDVRDQGRWPSYHQCRFKIAVTVNGKGYCKIHDPRAKEMQAQESSRRWNEQWNKRRYEIHGMTFYKVLKQIADGHNDPCTLAKKPSRSFTKGSNTMMISILLTSFLSLGLGYYAHRLAHRGQLVDLVTCLWLVYCILTMLFDQVEPFASAS